MGLLFSLAQAQTETSPVSATATDLAATGTVTLKPEYQAAYNRAMQAFNQNNFDAALKSLKEAETIQGGVGSTLNLRGAVYVRMKKYDEAAKTFANLYQLEPENTLALFNLAETYFLQKNYAEAARNFQMFLEKDKNYNAFGTYKLFLCYLQLGNETEWQRILANINPSISDPLYYYLNAAVAFKKDNVEEARGYILSAFRIYPLSANNAFINSLVQLGYLKAADLQANTGVKSPTNGQTAPAPVIESQTSSVNDKLFPNLGN